MRWAKHPSLVVSAEEAKNDRRRELEWAHKARVQTLFNEGIQIKVYVTDTFPLSASSFRVLTTSQVIGSIASHILKRKTVYSIWNSFTETRKTWANCVVVFSQGTAFLRPYVM